MSAYTAEDLKVGVNRCSWSRQPGSYHLVGSFALPGESFESEDYGLASLASQARGQMVHLRERSDVTNDVVRDAVREAVGLYAEGRCDPSEVRTRDLRVEERRVSRHIEVQ